MPVQIEKQLSAVRRVMVDSLNRSFTPFPVNRKICSEWTDSLPKGGERVIYTSFMYQLSGLFRNYEKHLSTFARAGGSARIASLGRFIVRPDRNDLERGYRILSSISSLLLKSGVEHGYLYDEEPYSGGLLLELGMLDEFRTYGEKVLALFHEKGVKEVITVDPHTTNAMMRLVSVTGSDLRVTNYLNLVRVSDGGGEYVLHDPCLYTRYWDLGGVLRKRLSEGGVSLREDRMVTSREYGTCCGGPLGPVDAGLSDRIARMRADKLTSVSPNVIVACPLCYQNLSPHISKIRDVAEVIS